MKVKIKISAKKRTEKSRVIWEKAESILISIRLVTAAICN